MANKKLSSISCGPNAIDESENEFTETAAKCFYRAHSVKGTGAIISNNAINPHSDYKFEESYDISSGITELGDSCFSKRTINNVTLPDTLVKIGNSCFLKVASKN